MDPAAGLTPAAPPQRGDLDPLDRRLTAGLLALLLGVVVALSTWAVIWPMYRDAYAPASEAEAAASQWPTTEVILGSLLVLALWMVLWVGLFFWALSRRH